MSWRIARHGFSYDSAQGLTYADRSHVVVSLLERYQPASQEGGKGGRVDELSAKSFRHACHGLAVVFGGDPVVFRAEEWADVIAVYPAPPCRPFGVKSYSSNHICVNFFPRAARYLLELFLDDERGVSWSRVRVFFFELLENSFGR